MEPQGSQLVAPRKEEAAPLRIVIDGRKLGDGGIGVYIDNLVRGLLEVGGVEVTLIARPKSRERSEYAADVRWILEEARSYSIDELLFMGRRLNLSAFDVFHSPHYTLPFGLSIPTVVTIHDLIHIHHPEKFYYPWVARPLIKSAVRRAQAVIAVSQHTRHEVLDLSGVSKSKVTCVPNGVPSFISDTPTTFAVGRRYWELSPFFLSVFSSLKPHKGLVDLIEAYRSYRSVDTWSEMDSRCPRLVLAGYGTEEILNSSELLSLISTTEGVHIAGPVAAEELAALYRKATALVVPSLAEGFCLPALEAQACGTPIVCRPVPALQELLTKSDVVATDFSIPALATAMAEGVLHSETTQRVVPTEHLELYTCARTASRVLEVYRRVLPSERVV